MARHEPTHTVIKQAARLRIVRVPGKANHAWGFGRQVDAPERSGNDHHDDVFVHATELQKAGLAPRVEEGEEYVADIATTDRGLRAINLGVPV